MSGSLRIVYALLLSSLIGCATPSSQQLANQREGAGKVIGSVFLENHGLSQEEESPLEAPPSTHQGLVLLVVNSANTSITEYSTDRFGNIPPTAVISGERTGSRLPTGIAVNSQQRIYVANWLGGPLIPGDSNIPSFKVLVQSGTVVFHSPTASGDAAPIGAIYGPAASLYSAVSVALDDNNDIVVASCDPSLPRYSGGPYPTYNVDPIPSTALVELYPAGSRGNVTPAIALRVRGISRVPGGVAIGKGMQLPEIYLTFPFENEFQKFTLTTSPGDQIGTAVKGPSTLLRKPMGIAVDDSGIVYVANAGGAITAYSPGSNGDSAPIAVIAGEHTGLKEPIGIALDSEANIYVADKLKNAILIFPAHAKGDIPPARVIRGNKTGLAAPIALAVSQGA